MPIRVVKFTPSNLIKKKTPHVSLWELIFYNLSSTFKNIVVKTQQSLKQGKVGFNIFFFLHKIGYIFLLSF